MAMRRLSGPLLMATGVLERDLPPRARRLLASGRRFAYPDCRHHPALCPVVRVVEQRRGRVERCRVEPSAVNYAVAHLGQEHLKIQRPAITTPYVLHVGPGSRMSHTQFADHAWQFASDEPIDPVTVAPFDQTLPGGGPHVRLRGKREMEVRLLNQQPSARLDGGTAAAGS